jgi:hypothetical protein
VSGSGEGSQGNREVPRPNRPLEEGGPWGKHGFPHGSEPEASDAVEGFIRLASLEPELAAARARAVRG